MTQARNERSIIINNIVGAVNMHRMNIIPVSTMVGVWPAVRVFDSIKVIFPGISISKRCICDYM